MLLEEDVAEYLFSGDAVGRGVNRILPHWQEEEDMIWHYTDLAPRPEQLVFELYAIENPGERGTKSPI